jgi:RHS repeat-associated protein
LPFGTPLDAENSGVGSTNQKFTSYDRSPVTGLDYAMNRTYASGQGRFTQVDPLGATAAVKTDPQSLNLYSYVRNEPTNFVDPSGLLLIILIPYNCHQTEPYGQWVCQWDIWIINDNPGGGGPWNPGEPTGGGGGGGGSQTQQQQKAKKPCEKDKKKKDDKKKDEKTPPSDPEAIKVNTDINKDLKVLDFSSEYIDKDNTGQVPVGGKFSITYRVQFSSPQKDMGDDMNLNGYASIQSFRPGDSFAATENLETVSSESRVIGTKGSATILEKTDVFKVKDDKNSGMGRRSGTRAINYIVSVKNPESAGGGSDCAFSDSKPGKYVEVRIP